MIRGASVLLGALALAIASTLVGAADAPVAGLGIVCKDAAAAGQRVANGCGGSNQASQVYAVPVSGDLVRVDSTATLGGKAVWANVTFVWKDWQQLAAGELYESCDTAIAPGESVANSACASWSFRAKAASGPAVFTATPSSGLSPLAVTLAWNVPAATSCTASGAWSGTKAASGTEVVTVTAAASFTLACAALTGPPANGEALLSWSAVTQNTDGSPATIVGYRIWQAVGTGAMLLIQNNINPTARTSTVPGLPPGKTYSWELAAFSADAEGGHSGVVSKTIPSTPTSVSSSVTASVTITAPPAPSVPRAPVLTVQ